MRSSTYHTHQEDAVLGLLRTHAESCFTAGQIARHFDDAHEHLGRTTIYRQLNKLVAAGKVIRCSVEGHNATYYQYASTHCDTPAHYHLKCTSCGEIFHLDHQALPEIAQTVKEKFSFSVDVGKIVLYGHCSRCKPCGDINS